MLDLTDRKWEQLKGGYQSPYSPVRMLLNLENGIDVEESWNELWDELHHQGDVGLASYAAVPHLVRICQKQSVRDWNFYGLVSTIEIERHRKTNPLLPDWISKSYADSWDSILDLAVVDLKHANDELTVKSIVGALVLAKGLLKLGSFISTLDTSEYEELAEQYFSWSKLYR